MAAYADDPWVAGVWMYEEVAVPHVDGVAPRPGLVAAVQGVPTDPAASAREGAGLVFSVPLAMLAASPKR